MIQMVDLKGQYEKIKEEIDAAVLDVVSSTAFINGPSVKQFQANLEHYLGVKHVIPCANGTDALQVSLMALGLEPGDEVLVPAFTYVATMEVIALLGLNPVMVDVDESTFNTTADIVEAAITPNTRAIVPVHLFGQSCDMEPIMEVARKHRLFVIEDNAQAIGADYTMPDGSTKKAGTVGNVGCTSFFPAKNLGCYGDGGAIFTDDDELAARLRMVVNHGQSEQYYHDVVGVNSRLDSIQAAVLDVKLKYLDQYAAARNRVAETYDEAFENIEEITTPVRERTSTHVFHQYTLKVGGEQRDALKAFLNGKGIPANIYYPLPLYDQKAYSKYVDSGFTLPATERLCRQVLSLPIHTEMTDEIQAVIIDGVNEYFAVR
ncbi:MAG: DegT/DnrJ/EryC1/StrS family aminotransferase [Acidobacteriota bacterium]|nr:DegT/DnrJ/EryC1/StrS family aminotransferase [Acidobacteriota bacterium]